MIVQVLGIWVLMPQKDNGDNDFHVLTVCAEIIMMKEKVIVILK